MRPATQRRYAQCLLRLLAFLQLRLLPAWTAAEWDMALVSYLEMQFDCGRPIGDGNCLPSALVWARPALGGPVRRLFPAASVAYAPAPEAPGTLFSPNPRLVLHP